MIKIHKITSGGAETFIQKYKPNCLIIVIHPNCNYCKSLRPTLDNLYTDIKTNYSGKATIFDLHGDAAHNSKSQIPVLESVNGYPTILISKKNTTKPVLYSGDRSKEDIIKFMTDNLNIKQNTSNYLNDLIQSKSKFLNSQFLNSQNLNSQRVKNSKVKSQNSKSKNSKSKKISLLYQFLNSRLFKSQKVKKVKSLKKVKKVKKSKVGLL